MRKFINKHAAVIIVILALGTAIALYLHFTRNRASAVASASEFFLDEETNEESVLPVSVIPPLTGKNGKPTVVHAVKISCDGGKTSSIAFLEQYTPDAQSKLQTLPPDDPERNSIMQTGLLIRLPAPGSPWWPSNSPEGNQIRENIPCPPGSTITLVRPQP